MEKDIVCSQQVVDREDAHSTGQLGRKDVEGYDICHVVSAPTTHTQVSPDCSEENITTRMFETEMFKFYLCKRIEKRYFWLQLQYLKNQREKLSNSSHLLSKSLCMPLCKCSSARIQSQGYTSSIHTSDKSSWQEVSCISTGHCLHRVPSSTPQPSCNGAYLWVEAIAIARFFCLTQSHCTFFFSLSTGSLLTISGNCL